jgi:uncharacterized membrane protein YhaH (DUF805 family)
MNMIDYYLYCFQNYAKFDGRARRSEYWYFILCNVLVLIILAMLTSISDYIGAIMIGVYLLAMIVPWIAVTVRRLHDSGKPGGYFFVRFIPLVGGIWSLVLMFAESQPGQNEYGPNPKGIGSYENNDDLINSIGNQ